MPAPFCHGREATLNKRQAQTLKPAATRVRTMYSGSFKRCGPSITIRTMCAKVISPKTTPVVTRYAFIDHLLVIVLASVTVVP